MVTPRDVLDRWNDGRDVSQRYRHDFWLNHEYYHGRQWVTIDTRTGIPHQILNPDRRIRVTHNRVGPNGRTLIGKFAANPLMFDVTPDGADDQSIRGARCSQYAVRSAAEVGNWETHRKRGLQHVFFGGCALAILNPVGPELEVISGKPAPLVAHVEVLPLPSFVCEPGALSFEQARWFITQRALPPGTIRDHYGLNHDPKSDTMAVHQFLSAERQQRTAKNDMASLFIMYERPKKDRSGKKTGPGKVVHCTAHEVLLEEDWPYPFDCQPGWMFMIDDTSDSWLGETFFTDARSPQDSLNFLRSQQAEATRAMVPKLAVPSGFDIDQLNDDPASPYVYDPVGGGGDGAPKWISGDSGTLRLRYDIESVSGHIDEVMHVHDLTRGIAGERASGQSIAILSEKDDTPLSAIAGDQRLGWAHIGHLYLKMAEKMINKEVIASIKVGTSTVNVPWSGKLIAGQTRVTLPVSSTQPFSRAARNKTIIDLAQAMPDLFATLTPIQKLAMMDLPELPAIGELLSPDVERAQRENYLISAGTAWLPRRDEDHSAHLAEHRAFRQTAAYDALDSETQMLFLDHERAHDRLLEEEVVAQRSLNEDIPGASALPSSLNMIGQVGPEAQPIPYQ